MKHERIINIKNPVFRIKVVESGLIYVLDTLNTIRIFDENFKLKSGARIKMPAHNPFENTADISIGGNYIAIADKNKKTYIWDINKKAMKYKFGWHKGDVLNVSFDWEEKYLLTGGTDGRAYLWSLKLGRMLLALPPHPDYILTGGFSRNNLWTATGSYDRLITITNVASPNFNFRKKSHRGAVNKIKFFDKSVMISGDKTGEIIKWDFRKGKILQRFTNMADMVIDFDTDENQEFLFAITKEKRVYLYDFETGELLIQEFVKLSDYPTTLCYNKNNNHLYVGCVDGSIYIFDLLKDKLELEKYLITNDYEKAYELIKINPLLKRTDAYKKLENIWERTLENIYKLLEAGKIDEAKKIFAPFSASPLKRALFQNLLKDYGDFEKFKSAVINKRYPLAYSLVRAHPVFKQSAYYNQMEQEFKKAFNKARELIKLGREEQAKEILKPFRGVSEKTALIQSIFNEKVLYDLLRQKLGKKDFVGFFELINRYPFLSDTDEYELAMKYAENLKAKAQELLNKGEYQKAIQYAEVLSEFPNYKEEALDIIQKAKTISNFLYYLANGDFDTVEDYLNKYSFLETLKDYQEFMRKYKNMIYEAEQYALLGDVKTLKEKFSKMAKYKTVREMLLNLVKRAYLNQIITLFKDKELDKITKSIKNYIALFGFDNEIGDLLKMAKKNGAKIILENYEKSVDIPFESLPDFIWDIDL